MLPTLEGILWDDVNRSRRGEEARRGKKLEPETGGKTSLLSS